MTGILVLMSVIPLLLVGVTYTILVLDKSSDHNFSNLMSFQSVVIWYGSAFCIFTKTFLFIKEEGQKYV